MKLASLFNLITDAQDILDLFEDVTTVDQLKSRLGRVRQLDADDLLTCLDSMRTSIAAALHDTLEMSPDLDDTDEELDEPLTDEVLDKLTSEENQNPDSPPTEEKSKNNAT